MKLSIPFLKPKKETSAFYLALLLTSEKASAIILEESLGKIKIQSQQNQFFEGKLEELSLEDLIENVDKVVSRASEILPPNIDIRKTVFGVKEDWVEKESKKIKKDYLQKLKKLCDALELSPIGFMVVSEAISNLMQKEEGAPLSAILTEVGRKKITLTLFRGGNCLQVIEGDLEGSYAHTVDNLLKHFTIEVLPARIILYNHDADDKLSQQFIGHLWSKSLPFLHMPQISILPTGFDGQAVAFGAAMQMGFEVLESASNLIKTYSHDAESEKEKNSSNHPHQPPVEEPSVQNENFGFIQDADITENPHVSQMSHHKSDSEPISIGPQINTTEIENNEESIDEERHEETFQEKNNNHPGNMEKLFDKIKLPGMSIPSFAYKGILLPILIILLIFGMVAGGTYYLYVNKVKAQIIVDLTPKKVTESKDIVFTADTQNDISKNIIAATLINDTLDGDMTIGATGKKDVGDKATGSVTIYNNDTDSDITLSSGTAIKSDNGLSFVLSKDVAVASASGDIFSGTKPGTATVDVTAGDIGTNYNLPSATKFVVESNNSLAAKNDSAFSGGTKKSIKIVSKDDLAKLKTDLLKNLEEKAAEKLAKQTQTDSSILPIILSTAVDKTKYDKNAGDESKTVKLSATISYKALSYNNSDTKNFAKEILAKNYGNDKTFNEESIDVQVKDIKKISDNEISASLDLSASLLPKIETASLAKQLSGKSQSEATNILSHLPQVENSIINYSPNIYFLAKLFPRLPNNVTVTLSSN